MALYAKKGDENVRVSVYDTKYMLTLRDLFPNNSTIASEYLIKKENAPTGSLKNLYHVQDNSSLVRKIFRDYMLIVLSMVAKGKCAFKMPNRSGSTIYLGYMDDKAVQYKAQHNQLKKIDLVASRFKVPYITYNFSPKYKKQELKIFVTRDLYNQIVKVANENKDISKIPYDFKYFLPQLYKKYPDLAEGGLKKLVFKLLVELGKLLREGHEIRMVGNDGEIRFFRPLGKKHDKVMKEIYTKYKNNERNKCK